MIRQLMQLVTYFTTSSVLLKLNYYNPKIITLAKKFVLATDAFKDDKVFNTDTDSLYIEKVFENSGSKKIGRRKKRA